MHRSGHRHIGYWLVRNNGSVPRRGSVLVVVLIVVVLLTLGVYRYTNHMLTEHKGVVQFETSLQTQAASESGIHVVETLLADQRQAGTLPSRLDDSTSKFKARPVGKSGYEFSVLAPTSAGVRFGVTDESTRININAVASSASDKVRTQHSITAIMALPGMTKQIAAAILDDIDSDSNERQPGSEVRSRNRRLTSLSDLLYVTGVTPELLYGQWAELLTLHSSESNTDRFGKPRVQLNSTSVESLYQKLIANDRIDALAAKFIVALKLYGVAGDHPLPEVDLDGPFVAGIFVPDGSMHSLQTVSDLIDKTVHVPLPHPSDEKDEDDVACDYAVLESPFRSDGAEKKLSDAFDVLTTSSSSRLIGRININKAKREAVLSIPGICNDVTEAIMAARGRAKNQQGLGFYITENHLSVDEFRLLEPYVTSFGHVYSATSIGHSESTSIRLGTSAVIDVSTTMPRVLSWNQFRPTLQLLGRAGIDGAARQK